MLTAEEALEWIKKNPRVAIVGLSPKEDRPSHRVGRFLMEKGFEITPVHPVHEEIMGQKAVQRISDLDPEKVDWLDLFVAPIRLMGLLDEIKALRPKLVWCQIGVVDQEFNRVLEELKIPFVADVCPKMEWEKRG